MLSRKISLAQDARKIFKAAIKAVSPDNMVKAILRKDSENLLIAGRTFPLDSQRIFLVGFGKAVLGMARTIEKILGPHLHSGILSVPIGSQEAFEASDGRDLTKPSSLRIYQGAENNIPDEAALTAAKEILQFVESLKETDLLLVLISGGGSALLPLPIEPITLKEKVALIKLLANHGADIQELNTVRKKISAIKGGKLALAAWPAKVIALILSDVIGDHLDQVASGPTVLHQSDSSNALEIINKYSLRDQLPPSILRVLEDDGATDTKQSHHNNVYNYLIGNNLKALQAAEFLSQELGFRTCLLSTQICGEAKSFGELLGRIAQYTVATFQGRKDVDSYQKLKILASTRGISEGKLEELEKLATTSARLAILSGGETVVKVTGNGTGGRNQETALAFSLHLADFVETEWDITLLAAGTDGQDGPTTAAGAVAYLGQLRDSLKSGQDPRQYLDNNDSNTFYRKFNPSDLVITGITNTNVMDIHVLLISSKTISHYPGFTL